MAVTRMITLLACAVAMAFRPGEGSPPALVNFMSIQMDYAERQQDLPNIPTLAGNLGLTSLVKFVQQAELVDALSAHGPFTVFGPDDAAFSALPSWLADLVQNKTILTYILEYHVLDGKFQFSDIKDEHQVETLNWQSIRFNIYPLNNVTTAQCAPIDMLFKDQMASNGIIHELKAVMLPPSGNIVQAAAPMFKTLVKAADIAGLLDTLKGAGPYTVFAPTDAAFKKLNATFLANLLKDKVALTNVLKYHIAELTYCSAGLVSYKELKMLNQQKVTITVDPSNVKVNNANIIPLGADASVTNGVIHAIDTVLIPPGFTLKHDKTALSKMLRLFPPFK